MDKTKLGGYAKVIGKIAKESIKPFIIIAIMLCGFLIAFRNRSIQKYNLVQLSNQNNSTSFHNESLDQNNSTEVPNETLDLNQNSSSFIPMDYFKDSFEHTIFKIYYMMAGNHQTDNMGIYDLTLSNSMNFFLYFLFLFTISTLAFNIFTGIAINEIQTLIEHFNIQIMKDKIDYIYNGGYSIFSLEIFEANGHFKKFKKWVFGIIAIVFQIDKLAENIYKFFSVLQNRLLKPTTYSAIRRISIVQTFPADDHNLTDDFEVKVEDPFKDNETKKDSDDSSSDDSSEEESVIDETQTVFAIDKYIENFEAIENRIKNLEDKYMDNFEAIENRIKSQENKLDQILRLLGASKIGDEQTVDEDDSGDDADEQ